LSPELALGGKVDARTDVYGLGVLCYQLLTGQLPITGESTIAVLMAHVTQVPPRISDVGSGLTPLLDEPILRMLEKEASRRPASAGEAFAELKRAAELAGHDIPSGMPRLPPPPRDRIELVDSGEASARVNDESARSVAFDVQRSTSPSNVQTGARKAGLNWAFFAFLGVFAAGAAFLVARELRSPEAGAEKAPASAQVAAVAPAPSAQLEAPAPAEAPSSVLLTVEGAPQGARIFQGDKLLGAAPGPVELASGNAEVLLNVVAPGHDTAQVRVVPEKSLSVTVKLKKHDVGAARRSTIPRDLESPF
jgi:serine/threonine-protein kinase